MVLTAVIHEWLLLMETELYTLNLKHTLLNSHVELKSILFTQRDISIKGRFDFSRVQLRV